MKIYLLINAIFISIFAGCMANKLEVSNKCNLGYDPQTGNCIEEQDLQSYSCTNIPDNANICVGDNQALLEDKTASLVSSCSVNKCEYTCRLGYTRSGSNCEPILMMSWQTILEDNFDIVETFDQYEDWIPDVTTSIPLKKDGGYSEFIKSVQYWNSVIPLNDRKKVITIYPGKAVKDSKALRLNWAGDGEGQQEASTFRYYFGDGTEQSGYNEIYLFGSIYIPSDKFPTDIDPILDQNGKTHGMNVKAGEQRLYMTSAKMIAIDIGYTGEVEWSNDSIKTGACRLGWSELWFFLGKTNGSSANFEIRPQVTSTGYMSVISSIDVSSWLDKRFYFEIYVKREERIGESTGAIKMTFFEANGSNETVVIDKNNISLLNPESSCHQLSGVSIERGNQMKYNRIVLDSNWRARDPDNGNKDCYLRCGNFYDSAGKYVRPLSCSSYYDDLIIDDKSIGQTYFKLLSQAN